MNPNTLQSRQQAYKVILKWGLLAIREAAAQGKTRLCEIEADHLHNIPTLLDEPNALRHQYYINEERSRYLERLSEISDAKKADPEQADFQRQRYEEAWKMLASLAV